MYERTYGAKYDKSLSTKDIAAIVRGEIKAAIAAGTLPKMKVSVRYESYSGGSAIRVYIKDADFLVINPTRHYLEKDGANWAATRDMPHRTQKATDAINAISAMLEAYNHDGSDSMSDYFDVNFYKTVGVDWALDKKQRDFLDSELAAGRRYKGLDHINQLRSAA